MSFCAFIPIPKYESHLRSELKYIQLDHTEYEGVFLAQEKPQYQPIWAAQMWSQCQKIPFRSITEAQSILKASPGMWFSPSPRLHRRTALIGEGVPLLQKRQRKFLEELPKCNQGFFLLTEKELIISNEITPSAYSGQLLLLENKEAPSRAYLKLWEFFTLTGRYPKKGDHCIDLGSSPGGWTWVLNQLQCQVTSVDKAELRSDLKLKENIHFVQKDAFKVNPKEIPPADWLFSDIICTPEKLLQLIEKWLAAEKVNNFVCTIKLKGEENFHIIYQFLKISNSGIIHLSQNKHELTWYRFKT